MSPLGRHIKLMKETNSSKEMYNLSLYTYVKKSTIWIMIITKKPDQMIARLLFPRRHRVHLHISPYLLVPSVSLRGNTWVTGAAGRKHLRTPKGEPPDDVIGAYGLPGNARVGAHTFHLTNTMRSCFFWGEGFVGVPRDLLHSMGTFLPHCSSVLRRPESVLVGKNACRPNDSI